MRMAIRAVVELLLERGRTSTRKADTTAMRCRRRLARARGGGGVAAGKGGGRQRARRRLRQRAAGGVR